MNGARPNQWDHLTPFQALSLLEQVQDAVERARLAKCATLLGITEDVAGDMGMNELVGVMRVRMAELIERAHVND